MALAGKQTEADIPVLSKNKQDSVRQTVSILSHRCILDLGVVVFNTRLFCVALVFLELAL